MVAIFSKTTCILSHQFVERFVIEELAKRLVKLGKDTGLEFNQDSETFSIAGEWDLILKAQQILEKYYVNENEWVDDQSNEEERSKYIELEGQPHKTQVQHYDKPLNNSGVPDPFVIYESDFSANEKQQERLPHSESKNTANRDLREDCTTAEEIKKKDTYVTDTTNLTACDTDTFTNNCDDSSTDIEDNSLLKGSYTESEAKSDNIPNGNKLHLKVEKQSQLEVVRKTSVCNSKSVSRTQRDKTEPGEPHKKSITASRRIKKTKSIVKGDANKVKEPKITERKDGEFCCDLCNYKGSNLKEHKLRKHSPRHACNICNKYFGFKRDLKRHMNSVHALSKDEKVKLKPQENIEEKEVEVSCDLCSYKGKKSNLKDHIQRTHSVKPRFSCSVCQREFKIRRDLNRHEKTVHAEATHYCELCKKYYKSKKQYDFHLTTHKDDYVKPYFTCEHCLKSFSTKYVLNAHIKAEHLGIKKLFICPTCGRSFTQKNSYLQHANVHAGIKPYVCDVCGKSFTYEKSLKEHKFVHEAIRRFQCDNCDKTFRQKSSLKIHERTHKESKDYICTACGKGFTQKQALLRHERIHSGDKPFLCGLCNKSFNDQSIIRRHMMLIHKKDPKEWQADVISNLVRKKDFYIEADQGQNGREPRAAEAVDINNVMNHRDECEHAEEDEVLIELSHVMKQNRSNDDIEDNTDTSTEFTVQKSALPSKHVLNPSLENDQDEKSENHIVLLPPPYPMHFPSQVTLAASGAEGSNPTQLMSLSNCLPLNYSVTPSHAINVGSSDSLAVSSENQVTAGIQDVYTEHHRHWMQTSSDLSRGQMSVTPAALVGEITQSRLLPTWSYQSYGPYYGTPNYPQYPQTTENSSN